MGKWVGRGCDYLCNKLKITLQFADCERLLCYIPRKSLVSASQYASHSLGLQPVSGPSNHLHAGKSYLQGVLNSELYVRRFSINRNSSRAAEKSARVRTS